MSSRRTIPQVDGCAQHFERLVIAALDLTQSLSKLLGLFRDDFLEMVAVVFDFLFQSLHVQRTRETGQDYICIHLKWLHEIVVRALAHRLEPHLR